MLGTSPHMFTDYSWFKDLDHDYKEDNLLQYKQKEISMLMAGMPEIILDKKISEKIMLHVEKMSTLVEKYEETFSKGVIEEIEREYEKLKEYFEYLPEKLRMTFEESISALKDTDLSILDTAKYPNLFIAFSRSQQYISFEKME